MQHQQGNGQCQREQHHQHTECGVPQRFRVFQAFHGLGADQYSTHCNEQRLGHAGKGFGLAVAKAVIVIGRAQGVVHGQQVDE
ncbi:hypothetical protein D3C76_970190 [compost metagenome]